MKEMKMNEWKKLARHIFETELPEEKKSPELNHFARRTMEHIHRVQERAVQLIEHGFLDNFDEEYKYNFLQDVMGHDSSKFEKGIRGQYVFMSYKKDVLKEKLSKDEKKEFYKAFDKHYKKEDHHPESPWWKHENLLKARTVLHCACDLQAMSDEFNQGSEYFYTIWAPRFRELPAAKRTAEGFLVLELMTECFEFWSLIDNGVFENEERKERWEKGIIK